MTIEPPEEPPEPPELVYTIGLMTLNTGGVGGGTSRKFGNVRINLKSLLIGLVGTTGTIASPGQVNLNQSIIDQPLIQDVLNQPIVVSVLAAFLALYEFNKMLSVSITEREATVVWAIWKNKDDNDCVSDQDLIVLVNKERKIYKRSSINEQELDESLNKLESLKCIMRSEKDKSKWSIVEKVNVKCYF